MKYTLPWSKDHLKTDAPLAVFGKGINRIAMLEHSIPDFRAFFDSGLRGLRHYGFNALDMSTLHRGLSE